MVQRGTREAAHRTTASNPLALPPSDEVLSKVGEKHLTTLEKKKSHYQQAKIGDREHVKLPLKNKI